MERTGKLTLPLQLVGVTAALVFCFAALTVSAYLRALLPNLAMVMGTSNWFELFIPIIAATFVTLASVAVFCSLLYLPPRSAALVSLIYLAALLLFHAVHAIAFWFVPGSSPHSLPSSWLGAGLVFQLAWAAWLVALWVKVWPNYSFKRTADVGLR